MDTIKCIRCGAENNDDYKFCINCGANLPQINTDNFNQTSVLAESGVNEDTAVLDFDGVSACEMTAYVSNNANKILPKFYNMEKFKQRVSFSFSVFFLGLFLGFFGISMWCFYRKMKSLGLISLLVGFLFVLADVFLNYNTTTAFISGYVELMRDLVVSTNGVSPAITQASFENLIAQYSNSYISVFSFINQYVGGIICPVLMGMFGLHLYKTQAIADIKEVKGNFPEEAVLSQIAQKGGTSKLLLLIPIAACILIFLLVFAIIIMSFLSVI